MELLSQRSENSQVYVNPDGTYTQDVYATAQRVRQGNALVGIDPTLQPGADGRLTTKATAVGLEFSGGGSGPLATITRDGRSVSLTWPGGALPAPVASGDSATYPEVLPGVDLKVRAGVSGFGELLVVKSAQAAANPALANIKFQVATDGVTLSTDAGGNLKAVNPAGQEVFTAPMPLMWDSSTPAETSPAAQGVRAAQEAEGPTAPADEFEPGTGAQQGAVPIEVAPGSMTLTPDQTLLQGAGVTYPVYIDPTIGGSREAWTIVDKAYPTGTFYKGSGWGSSGTTEARVGHENDTGGTARSFFQMDSNNLWNTNKSITKSTFRIKNTWSWSCADRTVEMWLTDPISSSTSWNNQPTWTTKLSTSTHSYGYTGCAAANQAYDVTAAAKKAATGKKPNITLGMRVPDSSEGDVYAWKKFDANTAVLSTDYNTYPSKPTRLYTVPDTGDTCGASAPYTTIGNTDVTFGGTFSDPDGGTVKAHFTIWPTGYGSGDNHVDQTVSVTSGKAAKLVVPRATLAQLLKDDGITGAGTYTWFARTEDGSLNSTYSTQCHFVFDGARPSNPPTVASTQFPDGSDGWPADTGQSRTPGTFTLGSGGITDVAKYEYWTDWDPTVRTATPSTSGGSVTLTLTPPAAGAHALTVRSVDKGGNKSDATSYRFYANGPSTPDKDGDLNGDGIGDLYAVTDDGTLRFYAGQGDGHLSPYTVGGNTDFTGASITHRGDWTSDGYEDLMALMPGTDGKTLHVFPNNGYGFACTARDEQADGQSQSCLYDEQPLNVYDPADNHYSDAQQILAVGDVDGPVDTNNDGTIDVPGHADLLVKEGDLLWLYFGSDTGYLDETRPPVLIGNGGWSHNDLAAPGDLNGDTKVDLIARDQNTGDLNLYPGAGPNGEGLGNGHTLINIGWAWTPASRPLLTAVPDTNGDAKPDLWATTAEGTLSFYSNSTGAGTMVGSSGWTPFQQLS